MSSDHDRIASLNFVEVWALKLTTAPGGIITMRQRMLDAAAGVKGQNYDPDTRSDRYELVEFPEGPTLVKVPANDPTGEAAITPDDARRALEQIDRLLNAMHKAAQDLAGLHDVWCPPVGAQLPLDTGEGPGVDWCASCWRDDKHCEPSTERYRGRCRFCGDWRAEHKQDPPMPILKARHRGERITSALVAKYMKQPRRKAS